MPVTNYYSFGDELIGEKEVGGTRRNYAVDALGSVTATIVDGAIENTYAYKPYGGQLQKTGSGEDPKFRWVGTKGYSTSNRSYAECYVRARSYVPSTSRWTTLDPLWPDLQGYVYGYQCPTTLVDASGKAACLFDPPGTECSVKDMATAQAMIEAAYAAGGACLVRQTLAKMTCYCPHVAAALAGWWLGRKIDQECGISDKIIETLWPSDLPPLTPKKSASSQKGNNDAKPTSTFRHHVHTYPKSYDPGPRLKNGQCPKCTWELEPRVEQHNRGHVITQHGVKGCCLGLHKHIFIWDQNKKTCTCFFREVDIECLGTFVPESDCKGGTAV